MKISVYIAILISLILPCYCEDIFEHVSGIGCAKWSYILSGIPFEFRGLSLDISESQLQSAIKKNGIYSKKQIQKDCVDYWLLAIGGETAFVGFKSGRCVRVQGMPPVPRGSFERLIGNSEYNTWMLTRTAEQDAAANP